MYQPEANDGIKAEIRRQEQVRRNQAAIDLLNAWEQEDAEEQRETWEYLKQALAEDQTTIRG